VTRRNFFQLVAGAVGVSLLPVTSTGKALPHALPAVALPKIGDILMIRPGQLMFGFSLFRVPSAMVRRRLTQTGSDRGYITYRPEPELLLTFTYQANGAQYNIEAESRTDADPTRFRVMKVEEWQVVSREGLAVPSALKEQ
jgi:hypothetical protein